MPVKKKLSVLSIVIYLAVFLLIIAFVVRQKYTNNNVTTPTTSTLTDTLCKKADESICINPQICPKNEENAAKDCTLLSILSLTQDVRSQLMTIPINPELKT